MFCAGYQFHSFVCTFVLNPPFLSPINATCVWGLMPWLEAIKGHHLGSVWMCWTSIPRCARRPQEKNFRWLKRFFFWYPKIHDVSIETDNCCEILGPKPSKATGFPHSLSILFLPKKISIGIKSWEIAEGFPTMPSRIVWSASKGFGSWRPAVAKWPFDPFWNEVNYMWKSMKI